MIVLMVISARWSPHVFTYRIGHMSQENSVHLYWPTVLQIAQSAVSTAVVTSGVVEDKRTEMSFTHVFVFCPRVYPPFVGKCIERIGSVALLSKNGDQRLPTNQPIFFYFLH